MSTNFCQLQSGARSTNVNVIITADSVDYGVCDVYCEFVLAFRSLATVAVYLWQRQRRAELLNFRELCRMLWGRLSGKGTPSGSADVELLALEPDNAAVAHDPHTLECWRVAEADVVRTTRLGKGAYAEVWAGTWKQRTPVAIKVLLANAFDENANAFDPRAKALFGQECDSLIAVNHPNVLKFFGFGTTSSGESFIVCELMSGGSLRSLLQSDVDVELPWRWRLSTALMVASGMAHLHGIGLVGPAPLYIFPEARSISLLVTLFEIFTSLTFTWCTCVADTSGSQVRQRVTRRSQPRGGG
jgi:hypothetical protein